MRILQVLAMLFVICNIVGSRLAFSSRNLTVMANTFWYSKMRMVDIFALNEQPL